MAQIEVKDLGLSAGESLLMKFIEGMDDSTPVSNFVGATGAMNAGYEGIVTKADFIEVGGNAAPLLTSDQIIKVGDKEVIIAKKGQRRLTPTIEFDGGVRTMTVGLLQQGQKNTIIKLKGRAYDGTQLDVAFLKAIVGKKLKCTSYTRDEKNPIIRYDDKGVEISRKPANCYTLEEA